MYRHLMRLAATLAPLAAAAAAWAQDNAPPQPRLSKSAPAWMGFAVMVILLALVIGVSLMPSKRGHQD
jgi:FtsH-binding integral membrane protein